MPLTNGMYFNELDDIWNIRSFYYDNICYFNVNLIKIIHDLTTFTALQTSMFEHTTKAV